MKSISDASRAYLENEEFQRRFCTGCRAIHVTSPSFSDPGDVTCPCDFDPSDEDCHRSDDYEDIVALLRETDLLWGGVVTCHRVSR